MFVEAIATRHEAQSLQPLLQNQGCKAFTRRDASRHEITVEEWPFRVAVSKQEAESKTMKKKKRWNDGENGRPSLDRNKITENSHRVREPVVETALKILPHVVELL